MELMLKLARGVFMVISATSVCRKRHSMPAREEQPPKVAISAALVCHENADTSEIFTRRRRYITCTFNQLWHLRR
jgi:hypothetical protein